MPPLSSAGGWSAIRYTLRHGRRIGFLRLWNAMRSRNACKTCALGMGGQQGGMRNERGHFPEVCKKSLQAMAADMQGRIEDRFFAEYPFGALEGFSPRELEMMGRLVTPLYAGPGESSYRPIAWAEAMERIAAKLGPTDPRRAFFYSSGRSSNEAGFLLQLFARIYGTNHVNNCSYYCHQASGAGLADSIGTGTSTVSLDDIDRADLFVLIGGNPASNHPRLMTSLMKLRRRGGHVIVVNPAKELGLVNFRVPSDLKSLFFGSEIASLYVQPTIGGDIALLSGVAKLLLERGAADRDFIDAATTGFSEIARHADGLSWEQIEGASGVPRGVIERFADLYAQSQSAIFGWTMGITHHEHGVANVQWIANLALLRGMVGRPGAGLLPIRGHSNVQGLGTVGVTPGIRKAVLDRLGQMGIEPPAFAGYDTLACIEAAGRGEMDFGFALGGNLFGSNPDASFAKDAIGRLGMMVYLTTTLNTGHAHGRARETIVLPVAPRDEEAQPTTQESMFSFVRLSDGGPARHDGPRSEVSVIAELGRRVLPAEGRIVWREAEDHNHVRRIIARIVPGLERISDIGSTKEEFHIPGRVLHAATFPTEGGKAAFRAHSIPRLDPLEADQLRLMTVRSEGQFNTVVYEEEDLYRDQERRDVILINPRDIARMGLSRDQRVTVASEVGRIESVLVRPFDISAGCALMYYPEANVLVPRRHDAISKTPAFKSVVVRLTPAPSATMHESVHESPHESPHESLVPLQLSVRKGAQMKAC
jgi:molybdopterin-dependent oxidoreductase alpha subunit